MPLRITRAVDSVLYGGWDLDPSDLEGSCDHRIWVRRVRDTDKHQDALINIESQQGVTEEIINIDEPMMVDHGIELKMVGVQRYHLKPEKHCKVCDRGDHFKSKYVPQARIAVDAPREYEVIRHDARKKR
jgi:hypothetical protein